MTADPQIGGQTYRGRVLADGAVGYWRLGEPSGTVAVDLAPVPHNGVYAGGVTLAQVGAIDDGDTAALFNGTTGKATIAAFDPLSGLAAASFEGWVNHNSVAWPALEIVENWGTTGQYLAINTGGNAFCSFKISGVQRTATGAPVSTSGWHHVVATWASGGMIRLYADGVPVGTPQGPFSGTLDSSPTGYIGVFGGTSAFFDGLLDEVAVYPVELTAQQVAEHYALRLAASHKPRFEAGPVSEDYRPIVPDARILGHCVGLWIGAGGAVRVEMLDGTVRTLPGVPAGTFLRGRFTKVTTEGTTVLNPDINILAAVMVGR
jgi:hypothetical protein